MSKDVDPLVFAFWQYDQFPHVLGDQGRLLPDGDFKAHGYGGATFARERLIGIYPVALGVTTANRLKAMKQEYDQDLEELNRQYRHKFSAILPELKHLKEFK